MNDLLKDILWGFVGGQNFFTLEKMGKQILKDVEQLGVRNLNHFKILRKGLGEEILKLFARNFGRMFQAINCFARNPQRDSKLLLGKMFLASDFFELVAPKGCFRIHIRALLCVS